jgi:hypothetical protein
MFHTVSLPGWRAGHTPDWATWHKGIHPIGAPRKTPLGHFFAPPQTTASPKHAQKRRKSCKRTPGAWLGATKRINQSLETAPETASEVAQYMTCFYLPDLLCQQLAPRMGRRKRGPARMRVCGGCHTRVREALAWMGDVVWLVMWRRPSRGTASGRVCVGAAAAVLGTDTPMSPQRRPGGLPAFWRVPGRAVGRFWATKAHHHRGGKRGGGGGASGVGPGGPRRGRHVLWTRIRGVLVGCQPGMARVRRIPPGVSVLPARPSGQSRYVSAPPCLDVSTRMGECAGCTFSLRDPPLMSVWMECGCRKRGLHDATGRKRVCVCFGQPRLSVKDGRESVQRERVAAAGNKRKRGRFTRRPFCRSSNNNGAMAACDTGF